MTLLEVLLVLAILAVIASMVVPSLIGRQRQANIDATKLSIHGVAQALEHYALDHLGEFPPSSAGLEVLWTAPADDPQWKGPYLDKPARDAWGRLLQYQYPGQHNPRKFDVWSLGSDGVSGNEDDVTNWEPET